MIYDDEPILYEAVEDEEGRPLQSEWDLPIDYSVSQRQNEEPMLPNKVTIEITPKEYRIKVFAGKRVVSDRAMFLNMHGATADKKGDVGDDLDRDECEELIEAIDSLSQNYDVAKALLNLAEVDT